MHYLDKNQSICAFYRALNNCLEQHTDSEQFTYMCTSEKYHIIVLNFPKLKVKQ